MAAQSPLIRSSFRFICSSTHLLVATSGHVVVVPRGDSRRCLHLQFPGLDLHVAAARLVRRVLQGADLRADRLQVGRRGRPHLDLVHWDWEKEIKMEEKKGKKNFEAFLTFLGLHGRLGSFGGEPRLGRAAGL